MNEANQPPQSTADTATFKQMSWRGSGIENERKQAALREVLQSPLDDRPAIQSAMFNILRKVTLVLLVFLFCFALSAMEVDNTFVVVTFALGSIAVLCWRSGADGS
ncbi:MAG: hypothetical protein HY043_07630 [Verrucomicrobia bacterium]|nr:hypothetical protein [Verrucomicrobiota bacterium]